MTHIPRTILVKVIFGSDWKKLTEPMAIWLACGDVCWAPRLNCDPLAVGWGVSPRFCDGPVACNDKLRFVGWFPKVCSENGCPGVALALAACWSAP